MLSRLTSVLVVLATCTATVHANLNLTGAAWIWGSDAIPGAPQQSLPVETLPFRKNIPTGPSKLPTSVEVAIRADDQYTLYINGTTVGSVNDFNSAQYFCFRASPLTTETVFGEKVAIAVSVLNSGGGPAGLLAAVKVNYLGGGSDHFVTDSSWLSTKPIPNGFQVTDFNDSAWTHATVLGPNGVSPWGDVEPTAIQNCQ